MAGSCAGLCAGVSGAVSNGSLCLPMGLSNFGSSGLPGDLTSFMGLRKIIDFPVCSAFYYHLDGQSGNFQTLHAESEPCRSLATVLILFDAIN